MPSPSSAPDRVAVLELLGIGSLFYGFATVAEVFLSGALSGVLELGRVRRMIKTYSDHYIVRAPIG